MSYLSNHFEHEVKSLNRGIPFELHVPYQTRIKMLKGNMSYNEWLLEVKELNQILKPGLFSEAVTK